MTVLNLDVLIFISRIPRQGLLCDTWLRVKPLKTTGFLHNVHSMCVMTTEPGSETLCPHRHSERKNYKTWPSAAMHKETVQCGSDYEHGDERPKADSGEVECVSPQATLRLTLPPLGGHAPLPEGQKGKLWLNTQGLKTDHVPLKRSR